jgi:steroid delta-isomerase-like uncharacterized protein
MLTIHQLCRMGLTLATMFAVSSSLYAQTPGTDLQENKKIAESYITEVVNGRQLDLLSGIFAPTYAFHEMDGSKNHNISDSSLVRFLNYLFKAFPDLHYTIDNNVAENDLVALNLTGTGTQKDEFMGYPASNRKITFKEMFFFRLTNKRIVEGWGVVDLNGVIQQIK